MAQKKVTYCECDRCGFEEQFNKVGTRKRPDGWTMVMHMDLCPKCTNAFSDWVSLGKHSEHHEKVEA